jgi:zinc transport system permease protein
MFEVLLLPLFYRALVVGTILGIALAILGVFVVLRRLSFFSDAIGHSALTGIAIGLLLNINPFIGAMIFSLLVASTIVLIRTHSRLTIDTILGVLFPAAVALGVILVYLTPGYQTDLISFLFGDIITVSRIDVLMSVGLVIIVLSTMYLAGKKFISITVHTELARAEGIRVFWYELLLMLLLAATIALSIKLVGIVLVTAMVIIPAATAQNISRSLPSLFGISIVISVVTQAVGMLGSAVLHWPSGPTIVLTGAILFILSLLLRPLTKTA